tara:strand:- start:103 stop:378 length:276 start_codon:yes stop_codon:yes gene_type:complete
MRLYQLEQGLKENKRKVGLTDFSAGNTSGQAKGPPNIQANRTKQGKERQFNLNQPSQHSGQGPMMQMPRSQIRQTPINRYDYRGGMARSMG